MYIYIYIYIYITIVILIINKSDVFILYIMNYFYKLYKLNSDKQLLLIKNNVMNVYNYIINELGNVNEG